MTISGDDTHTVEYTNKKYGKITVDKAVLVNGAAPNNNLMDGTYYFGIFDGTGAEVKTRQQIVVSANGTQFTPGSVVFDELVPGTYTIKEMEAATGTATYDTDGVTVTVSADGETTVTAAKYKAVAVNGDEHTVHFTNDKTNKGTLTISKELAGATSGSFDFTVTKGGKWYNEQGEEKTSRTVLTLQWSATKKSITVLNLEPGVYTVTEESTGNTYKVEAKNSSTADYTETNHTTGTVSAGTDVTVYFRNTKYGKITVDKTVFVNGTAPNNTLMNGTYYFGLFEGNTRKQVKTITVSGNDGTTISPGYVEFTNLVPGTYTIKELASDTADADVIGDANITVTVSKDNGTVTTAKTIDVAVNGNDHTVRFTNNRETVQIVGHKTWVDAKQQHSNPELILKRKISTDADFSTVTGVSPVWSTDGKTYTYANLDKYDEHGNAYIYDVDERVPSGYTMTSTVNNTNGRDFINTELTAISAKKQWNGSDTWLAGMKVTLTLYRGDSPMETKTDATYGAVTPSVTIDSQQTVEWKNLPKYYLEGSTVKEYTYTVKETAVTYGTKDVSGAFTKGGEGAGTSGLVTINNQLKTRNITVEKTWKPSWPDDVTEVAVVLKANGSKANVSDAEAKLEKANPSKTWTGLPAYDETGKEIVYSVEETSVEMDGVTYNSTSTVKLNEIFVITENPVTVGDTGKVTLENEIRTTHVKVNKVWVFAAESNIAQEDLEDGTGGKWAKDAVVVITLYGTVNNVKRQAGIIELKKSCTSYDFVGLPVYDGEDRIAYSVEETAANNSIDLNKFSVSVDKNTNGDGYTITNREKQAGLTIIKHVSGKNLTDDEKTRIVFTVTGDGLPTTGKTKTLKEMGSGMTWTLTTKDGIIPGKTYTVTESGAAIEKYTKVTKIKVNDGAEQTCTDSGNVNASASVTVDASTGTGTINIWNTYTQDVGSVEVTKAFKGTPKVPDGFQIKNDYNSTIFTAANAVSGDGLNTPFVWKIENVPVGTVITFTESNTAVEGYTLSTATVMEKACSAVVKNSTAKVQFTNEYTQDVGSVEVTKTFTGTPKLPDGFQITNDYNKTVFTAANAVSGDGLNTPFVWKIENVPVGKVITFTESNTAVEGYTLSTAAVTEKTSTAVAKNSTVKVEFTNSYTQDVGSVEVTKIFTGTPKLPDGFQIRNDYDKTVFTAANAVSGDGLNTPFVWKIDNVPVGTVITFTESNTAVEGYTLSTASATAKTSAAVAKNSTVKVEFTNEYTQDLGAVEVTKTFTGTPKLPDGFQIRNDYNKTVFTAANAVSGDGLNTPFVWKIDNVPVGTVITFTENNTAVEGYTLSTAAVTEKKSSAVVKNNTVKVEFTNSYTQDLGSVEVTKIFKGTPKLPEGFQIRNDYNKTVFTAANAVSGDGLNTPFVWKIADVPVGTVITFTESNTAVEGYTLSAAAVTEKTSAAVVKNSTVTVEFTNEYTEDKHVGTIEVTKAFTGTPVLPEGFRITNDYDNSIFIAENADSGDGLKTPFVWKMTDVPVGTVITFTESNTAVEGYTLSEAAVTEKACAAVVKDDTVEVAFTNDYTRDLGALQILKNVTANGKATEGTLTDGTYSFMVSSVGLEPAVSRTVTVTVTNGRAAGAGGDGVTLAEEDGKKYARVEGLPTGDYTVTEELTEEQAKAGIILTEQPAGTLAVTAEGTGTVPTAAFTNNIITVKIQKRDVNTGEELTGAHIQILDKDGNIVEEWDSDRNAPHEVTGLKAGVEYTLRELTAPLGYDVTADTTFTIDEKGNVTATGNKTTDANGDTVLLVEDAPLTTTAAARKVWRDENNRDGIRPVSLTVHLKANGEVIATRHLSEENHWTLAETGLRRYDKNGDEIVYTWEEIVPVGYAQESVKTTGMLTTFTNTHAVETTSVSVKKVWEDNNNAEKMRPESIQVQLFANGKAEGKTVVLSEANGWACSWDGLPRYENTSGRIGGNREIAYTVTEVSVPAGYTMSISGSAAKGFVITNSIEFGKLEIRKEFKIEEKEKEPEMQDLTEVPVLKIWDDNFNRDGNRPAGVTVILMRGGEEIDRVTLTAEGGWTHTFTDLPKYENNLTIRYSITELPVEHYVSSIDGYTITNKYMPTVTSVSVRKVWDDNNNKAGMRPASVKMYLNNGMSVTLDESNGWAATITDLPAIVNGKPAVYTWTEERVPGYTEESKVVSGSVTTFTNKIIGTPKTGKAKTGGDSWAFFDEYDTPLGGQLLINHVGDCFD